MKKASLLKAMGGFLLAGLLTIVGCTSPMDSPLNASTSLIVSPDTSVDAIQVPITGSVEEQIITITSNASWTAELKGDSDYVDWIVMKSPLYGGPLTSRLRYDVLPNRGDNAREAYLIITSGTGANVKTAKVTIRQEGSYFLFNTSAADDKVNVLPAGEEGTLYIERSTRSWRAESDSPWLTLSPTEGGPVNPDPNHVSPANYVPITWTAQPNPSEFTARTAVVTFTVTDPGTVHTHKVFFIQDIAGLTIVDPATQTLAYTCKAGNQPVKIQANRSWKAVVAEDWIHVAPATGPAGTHTLTVSVDANPSDADREGKVRFRVDEADASTDLAVLIVKQDAAGLVISPELLTDGVALEAAAGVRDITEISSTNGNDMIPTITGDDSAWITGAVVNAAKDGITLTWTANDTKEVRKAKLHLKLGNIEKDVQIVQAAGAFTTDPDALMVLPSKANDAVSFAVSLNNGLDWTAQVIRFVVDQPCDWVSDVTPMVAENKVNFKVSANPKAVDRRAVIRLTCGSGENAIVKNVTLQQLGAVLTVGVGDYTFGPESGELTVPVSCDNGMPITYTLHLSVPITEAGWMTKTDLETGYKLEVTKNNYTERRAYVVITCGDLTETVNYIQKSAADITVPTSDVNLKAWIHKAAPRENKVDVIVYLSDNNQPCQVSYEEGMDWVRLADDITLPISNDGPNRERTLTFEAKEYNPANTPRTTTVTLACGDVTGTIQITQEAATFTLNPSNLNWTSKAGQATLNNFVVSNILDDVKWSISGNPDWITKCEATSDPATALIDPTKNMLELEYAANSSMTQRVAHMAVRMEQTQLPVLDFVCVQDAGYLQIAGMSNVKNVPSKESKDLVWANPVQYNGADLPTAWTAAVTSGEAWLSVAKHQDANGNEDQDLVLQVKPNPTADARTGIITVTWGELTLDLKVIQAGAVFTTKKTIDLPIYGLKPSDITKFLPDPGYPGADPAYTTAYADWKIKTDNGMEWEIVGADAGGILDKGWFSVEKQDNDTATGIGHLKFYDTDFNPKAEFRHEVITIRNGEMTIDITVCQAPAYLKLAKTEMILDADAQNKDVYAQSIGNNWATTNNLEPLVISNVYEAGNEWIKAQASSTEPVTQNANGTEEYTPFDLLYRQANPGAERVMQVIFKTKTENENPGEGLSVAMRVVQKAAMLTVVPDHITIAADPTADIKYDNTDPMDPFVKSGAIITVDAGADWTITNPEAYDWLTARKEGNTVNFHNVKANTQNAFRNATFEIVSGSQKAYLYVTQQTPNFAINPDYASFDAKGTNIPDPALLNTALINVTASANWTVGAPIPASDWFTVDRKEYDVLETSFEIRDVQPNPNGQVRQARIPVTCAGITTYVTVQQEGAAIKVTNTVGGAPLEYVSYGAHKASYNAAFVVTVTNGLPWEVALKDPAVDWLLATRDGADEIQVSLEHNATGMTREATLVVTSGNMTKELVVAQVPSTLEFTKLSTSHQLNVTDILDPYTDETATVAAKAEVYYLVEVTTQYQIPWTVEEDPDADWVRFEREVIGSSEYLVAIVEANASGAQRAVTAVVHSGEVTRNFRLIQQRQEIITDPAALPDPLEAESHAQANAYQAYAGASLVIKPTSLLGWTATANVDWIELPQTSGNYGDTFDVNLSANPTDEDRYGTVTITCGADSKILHIKQLKTEWYDDNTHTAKVDEGAAWNAPVSAYAPTGNPLLVDIAPDNGMPWTASIPADASWCHLEHTGTPVTGGPADWQVEVKLEPNLTGAPRNTVITITCGQMTRQIYINQPEAGGGAGGIDDIIAVSQALVEVGPAATVPMAVTVTLPSGGTWVATTADPWIHLGTASGSNGEGVFFTTDPNPDDFEVHGNIQVTHVGSGLSRNIQVVLAAAEIKLLDAPAGNPVSSPHFNVPKEGKLYNDVATPCPVYVMPTNGMTYTAELQDPTATWVHIINTGVHQPGDPLIIAVDEILGVERNTSITVKCGNMTKYVYVQQAGDIYTTGGRYINTGDGH